MSRLVTIKRVWRECLRNEDACIVPWPRFIIRWAITIEQIMIVKKGRKKPRAEEDRTVAARLPLQTRAGKFSMQAVFPLEKR